MIGLVQLAEFPLAILLNPKLVVQKIIGKAKRSFVDVSRIPKKKLLLKSVWFEYQYESYLNPDDYRAMYSESYDLSLISIMKKTLRRGDIFIDVGANVGYVSAIAAALVGSEGEVHSFEPLSICFVRLRRLKELNPHYNVFINQCAVGDEEGTAQITYSPYGESRNASLLIHNEQGKIEDIAIARLDSYINRSIKNAEKIRMIKIDVEGYEFPVLKGLRNFFDNTAFRPLIVCEIKPWELVKLNSSAKEFWNFMSKYSYEPFNIHNTWQRINPVKCTDYETILFKHV